MLVIIEGVGSHLCVALCVTGSNPLCFSVRDNDGSITVRYLYITIVCLYDMQAKFARRLTCGGRN